MVDGTVLGPPGGLSILTCTVISKVIFLETVDVICKKRLKKPTQFDLYEKFYTALLLNSSPQNKLYAEMEWMWFIKGEDGAED